MATKEGAMRHVVLHDKSWRPLQLTWQTKSNQIKWLVQYAHQGMGYHIFGNLSLSLSKYKLILLAILLHISSCDWDELTTDPLGHKFLLSRFYLNKISQVHITNLWRLNYLRPNNKH